MKISGATGGARLIEQMQRAHAEGLKGPKTSSASFSPEVSAPQGAKGAKGAAPVSGVERAAVGIARRVMSGELADAGAARREVVRAVVEERYGEALGGGSRTKRAAEKVDAMLSDDPNFAREVDEMLIHAARHAAVES